MQSSSCAYTNNTQSCNLILNELQDFFLLKCNMDKTLSLQLTESVNIYKNNQCIANTSNDTNNTQNAKYNEVDSAVEIDASLPYIPNHKDSLFWCFYIIKYGFDKFNMIDNKHFVIEKNEKISAIELLREKKDILKQYKIKSLSDVESDLTNSDAINIKTFFSLAIIYGFNVMYIKKQAYYEVICDDNLNTTVHIVKDTLNSGKKYSYERIQSPEIINGYRTNYYKMVSIDKQINAISTYKNSELLELSKKLSIDIDSHLINSTKKITKKDLYDAINAYFL